MAGVGIEPQTPDIMDREHVLASLGYKPHEKTALKPVHVEVIDMSACRRCGKKVYPVEKLDIGVLYHKGCFKCHQCGVTLSLKTFFRDVDAHSNTKEIYCSQHVPKQHMSYTKDALEFQNALRAQQKASRKETGVPIGEGWSYDQTEALGYQKLMRKQSGRKLKRKSTLRSFKDFEKYGVFDAQQALEKVHKEEEDVLYGEIFEDRKQQVHQLEKTLRAEREQTVKELVRWFEEKQASQTEREQGIQKVEQYFTSVRESRVTGLLKQLALDEQAAVTRMIEKHAQEMLALIAQKDHEAYRDIRRRSKDGGVLPESLSSHSLDHILNSGDDENVGHSTEEDVGHSSQENMGHSSQENVGQGTVEDDDEEVDVDAEQYPNADEYEQEDEDDDDDDDNNNKDGDKSVEDLMDRSKGSQADLSGSSEHVTDTAVTRKGRRNYYPNQETQTDDEDYDQGYNDDQGYSSKPAGIEQQTQTNPIAQKKQDKLDMSVGTPGKNGTPKVPVGSNLQPMRLAGGSVPSPLTDRGNKKAEDSENVPHAHGHVPVSGNLGITRTYGGSSGSFGIGGSTENLEGSSGGGSPYSRRRGVQSRDFEPDPVRERDTSPYRRRAPKTDGPKTSTPVLQIARPPKRDVETTPKGTPPRGGSRPKQEGTPTGQRKAQQSTPRGTSKGPPKGTPTGTPQGVRRQQGTPQTPAGQKQGGGPGSQGEQGTPGKRPPAYEINFHVPGDHPSVQVIQRPSTSGSGRRGNQEESDSDDSEEEYSSSEEEEGEYNTKAAGSLLRHPADDSKMVIDDADLPPRISKSDREDSSETETESETDSDEAHNMSQERGGKPRGISKTVPKNVKMTKSIDHSVPFSTPSVVPAKNRKSTLYDTEKVFEEFDNQAIKEAKKDHRTFTDLVRKLSQKCKTELQKVRALFRWITVKDLNKLDLDGPLAPDSPMLLLRGIKSGKESYHTLFKRLCSYAGLHCVIIDGYSKGAGYRPGGKLIGSSSGISFRNQWTAVNVDGSWRFINCNWGARHVKGPNDQALTYKCDEFYFLTDAEDHIYQHFPDDEEWQLLRKPITMEDFVKLPVTKSPFYNKHLSFVYKYPAVLAAADGQAEVRIQATKLIGLTAKLQQRDNRVPHDVLAERVLVRAVDNEMCVSVNLPMPGVYYLDVFVESDWRKNLMDHACAFAIKCTGVSKDAQVSYPPGIGVFGRTVRLRDIGMGELESSPEVVTGTGPANTSTPEHGAPTPLPVSLPPSHDPYVRCRQQTTLSLAITRDDVKLSHTFTLWSYKERTLHDLERYALVKSRKDGVVSFSLTCPQKGHYVFTVLAEDSLSEHPEVVYRYIVDCRIAADDARMFPRSSKRWQHCALVEPLQGDLPLDAQVVFRIKSEKATEIVVAIHGQWHGLQRQDGTKDLWQGVIPTGKKSGKALVYAKFVAGKSKYIPCLEYNILSLTKYSFV